jgi:mRNA interferase HigB
MRIISKRRLREYWSRHPDARSWLENWHKLACAARWKTLEETRRTFPHADTVKVGSGKSVTVFNVRGNRHRMITALHYNTGKVFILKLMPHSEYSKDQWKEQL